MAPEPRSSTLRSPSDETTPLLPRSLSRHAIPAGPAWGAGKIPEMWCLTKASIPVILAYMLQNSLQTVSIMIVGRLSPEALATAAFSYMFAMATAWLIALGGTTALDTLASSSFTASQDKRDLGVLLQRSIFVLTLFYAGVMVIWFASEPIFRFLSQEEFICTQSSLFLKLLAPGGLGYIWFECLKKYLQAQGIYHAGSHVLLVTSPLNALLNYLFVYTFGWGLYGAPVATGISYWLSFLALVGYISLIDGKDCWGGLAPRRAISNLRPFAKLAILGVIHVGTEWWAFEIVALAAGRLGAIPLAAQSVLMTVDQIINTIPFGLGVAASARIGNLLGARDPWGARHSAHSAALLSILFGFIILTLLLFTRDTLGAIFNENQDVVALVAEVMPLVAVFQIADGLNGSCGGALRAMGRQWVGALVNGISYYGGALPAGIFLAFHGWGLSGLWLGQCIALTLVGVLEWIIVGSSDWVAEVGNASKRLDEGDTEYGSVIRGNAV